MASEDRLPWLPGKRFSMFTGVGELARWGFSAPGQVPPAPVTDVSPEAGRERGDSIKTQAAMRLRGIRRWFGQKKEAVFLP